MEESMTEFAADDELADGEDGRQDEAEPGTPVSAEVERADAESSQESPSAPPAEEPSTQQPDPAQEQATQESLFSAEEPPVPAPEGEEPVTSFNAPVDDLAAVHADLAAEPTEDAAAAVHLPGDETEAHEPEGNEPEAQQAVSLPGETTESDVTRQLAPVLPVTDEPAETQGAETVAPGIAAAAESADEEAAAAVVEAGEPVGSDDEPEAVEALLDAEAEAGLLEPEPRDRIMSMPFFVYIAVWLLFTVAMVLALAGPAQAGGLDTAPVYPAFVFGGLFLTVVGPVLSLIVWSLARRRAPEGERRGLFASALLRGSLATFAGVALWWVGIIVLNYLKTGRLF
jgi:hypothetical protein